MDLALGLAFAGYHLWTYQRKPGIDITEPYLLNVPPEIRLLVYDLVFAAQGDQEKASDFLRLLLTCRLIYQEAYARAFTHTNFSLRILPPIKPYWTPQILKLPHAKWSLVRNVTIVWDSPLLEAKYLRPVFTELASLSLNLDQLVIKFKNQYAVAPFQFKYAPLYHGVHDVAKYIMEELPLMDNVKKIIFPNPSIEIKRNYQHLFDPTKPSLRIGGHPGLPLIDSKPKQLGKWKYTVVRVDKLVTTWRLEMTHPTPKAEKASSAKGASVPRKDQDDAIAP